MERDNLENANYYNDNEYIEFDGLKAYSHEIDKISVLSEEEELFLLKKIKEGDQEAKQRFIEANLKLVRYIVSKYKNRFDDIDDLIQEGNLALIRAIDSFDPDKGYKFSTYAGKAIKNCINNTIMEYNGAVDRSPYVISIVSKYNMAVEKLAKKLNHMPSKYEISEALGISIEQIDKINIFIKKPVRMDDSANDNSINRISDLIVDSSVNVEDEVLLKLSAEKARKLFEDKFLTPREKIVIYYLYGFNDEEPKTQAEISRILNLTRARVNQIVTSALQKLNPGVDGESKPKYNFDIKTKKALKRIQTNVSKEVYAELEEKIAKARQNKELDVISSIELIILLLNFGFVGNKSYAPVEIANVLGSDYYSMAPIINGVIMRYENIINKLDQDCNISSKKKTH